MKKITAFALPLTLLSCMAMQATITDSALNIGSSFAKNKWTRRTATTLTILALYLTLNNDLKPRKISDEEKAKRSKLDEAKSFVIDEVLGSPGYVLKGIPPRGFLGTIIAHWKAIVAAPLLVEQVTKYGPKIWDLLQYMVGLEAIEKAAEAVAKA